MVGRETTVVMEVMFAVGILKLVSMRERRNGGPEERRNGGPEERRNSGPEERRNGGPEERRNGGPEEASSPHSTSDTKVPTVVMEHLGNQTAGSQVDAQIMTAEQPGHQTASVHQPPAESTGDDDSPSEETCVQDDAVQVEDSLSDQTSVLNMEPVDNTQKLSSAFGLEHSALGFIPKDLDLTGMESTLFYYDQDTMLSRPSARLVGPISAATYTSPTSLQATPVTVSPVAAPTHEIVSRKGSESKLQQLHDDKAQFSTPPDSLQSPLCPNTPLYQTTILSIQSLNSTDDSDAPLFI